MKERLSGIAALAVITLALAVSAMADIKITTKNTAAGRSYEGTTYIKGERERTEGLGGMVMIYQCDLKRYLQLYGTSRRYMVTPINQDSGSAGSQPQPESRPRPQPQPSTRKGGIVTFTTTINDTGERKKMFGFTARHIKTTMTKEASPDACDPKSMKIETDGWYIDLQYGFHCSTDRPAVPSAPSQRARPDCEDQMRFKRVGGGNLGYPLDVTTTIYTDDGKTFTTSTQVTDLSTTTLDAALFDVPDGYTEAKSYQELMGAPSAASIAAQYRGAGMPDRSESAGTRSAGGTRVGVVMVSNKTDATLATDSLQQSLVARLNGGNVDAIPLTSSSPEAVTAEAKQKQCDYVLYTDVSDVKKPSTAAKIGGFIGRKSGAGSGGKVESNINYRLFQTGATTPALQSSSQGKDDLSADAAVSSALDAEAKSVLSSLRKK
jgi:hypothetical protein